MAICVLFVCHRQVKSAKNVRMMFTIVAKSIINYIDLLITMGNLNAIRSRYFLLKELDGKMIF
jgi:hypothetical protein